jgi:hypothetical protein
MLHCSIASRAVRERVFRLAELTIEIFVLGNVSLHLRGAVRGRGAMGLGGAQGLKYPRAAAVPHKPPPFETRSKAHATGAPATPRTVPTNR